MIQNIELPDANEELVLGDIHFIKNDDIDLIFQIDSCFIFECDQLSKNIISFCKDNCIVSRARIKNTFIDIGENIVDKAIGELIWSNILSLKNRHKNKTDRWIQKELIPNVLSPTNLSLNVTHRCNLNCSYCYGDGGSYGTPDEDMTSEVATASVDYLIYNAKRNDLKKVN